MFIRLATVQATLRDEQYTVAIINLEKLLNICSDALPHWVFTADCD